MSNPEGISVTIITPPASKPSKRDITGLIGPLYYSELPKPDVPMYSYSRPSNILWQAIFDGLTAQGWSVSKAIEWLQSKGPRWELDGTLGDAIEKLGREWADKVAREYGDEKPVYCVKLPR